MEGTMLLNSLQPPRSIIQFNIKESWLDNSNEWCILKV